MLTTQEKRRVIRLSIIAIVLYWLLGLSLIFILPAFRELFSAFGMDLPALTLAVINSPTVIGILILALYVVQIIGILLIYNKAGETQSYKQMFIQFYIAITIGVLMWITM
jgi:type II secretory pathway component PulF